MRGCSEASGTRAAAFSPGAVPGTAGTAAPLAVTFDCAGGRMDEVD